MQQKLYFLKFHQLAENRVGKQRKLVETREWISSRYGR